MKNANLNRAKRVKNDEFYTRLPDIAKEMKNYQLHFNGKSVLCNCDDPRVSNFFNFFAQKLTDYGLKNLVTTCYKNQDMNLFSKHDKERSIWFDYDGKRGASDPVAYPLDGDGDFRNDECI